MSRTKWIALGVIATSLLLVVAWIVWRGGPPTSTRTAPSAATTRRAPERAPRPELVTLPRARVSGKVKGPDGAMVKGAEVCAFVPREGGLSSAEERAARCATTGEDGAYVLVDLFSRVPLVVSAWSERSPPVRWVDPAGSPFVRLAEGEAKDGVDFVLRDDGVRVRGRVHDATGGVVQGAVVASEATWSGGRALAKTDDKGDFSMVVEPGRVSLVASAPGYADGRADGQAPGHFFSIHLLAGSTLVGRTVVAGSGEPVVGAHVEAIAVEGGGARVSTTSREDGHFRVEGLTPGRYRIEATSHGREGYSSRSVLLALAETSEEVRVDMDPAFVVAGVVVEKGTGAPCPAGRVVITDHDQGEFSHASIQPDGSFTMASVLAGRYEIEVECEGRLPPKKLPLLVVRDADPPPQRWEVDPGERLRVRVLDADKKPHLRARVAAYGERVEGGGETRRADADGVYVITGLPPGKFHVTARTSQGSAEQDEVVVDAGRETRIELVLGKDAAIEGIVEDQDKRPVAGVSLVISGPRGARARSGEDGSFRAGALPAGEYRVMVLGLDRRREGEDAGTKVTVREGETAKVTVVTAKRDGVIEGKVVDAEGGAVTDAYLDFTRAGRGPGFRGGGAMRGAPVITDTEGRFKLTGLEPGNYDLRAYRRGAGEARAEGVAVGTREVTLRISKGASVTGTLTDAKGEPVERFQLSAHETSSGFTRHELFFHTREFVLGELPPGDYELVAETPLGRASAEVKLAEGEQKRGVSLRLVTRTKVTGRVVQLEGGAPLEGVSVSVAGSGGMGRRGETPKTDAAGRFEITGVLPGSASLAVYPREREGMPVSLPIEVREDTGVDVGDVKLPKPRVGDGERPADLGFGVADGAETLEVRAVRGAAEAAGLRVGDVIVSVDGHDVRGPLRYLYQPLVLVPAGRAVVLGLERGGSVTVTAPLPADR